MSGSEIYVRAQTSDGHIVSCDVVDLDERSFRIWVANALFDRKNPKLSTSKKKHEVDHTCEHCGCLEGDFHKPECPVTKELRP